jgi:hypothetical protein
MPRLRRERPASALSRTFRDVRASTPFPRDSRDDATVLTRQLTDARRNLGRGSNLAGVAIDVRPGLCRSHNPPVVAAS